MLKKLVIGSIALISISVTNHAQASLEDSLANICAIVKADDKSELRKKLKNVENNYRVKLRDYYDGIKCGGNSLIRVAVENNALEAGTLLVKKMPKKSLKAPENDGKTLLAWISEQGHDGNPVAEVVKKRI
jgi:hypothetical protein